MKNLKKIYSSFIALILLVAMMAMNVFATNVTINDTTSGTTRAFNAYKILDASQAAAESTSFGYAVNDKYRAALKKAILAVDSEADVSTDGKIIIWMETLTATTLVPFATEMYKQITKASLAADDTLTSGTAKNLAEGYWLIKDVTTGLQDNETYSAIIVDTVGKDEVDVNAKIDEPEVEKKVSGTAGEAGSDDIEAIVGTRLYYTIEATIPAAATFDQFSNYYLGFTDTLSKGLTLDAGTIKIMIGSQDITDEFAVANSTDANGVTSLTANCDDLKAITAPVVAGGDKIVLSYQATVNKEALITDGANSNKVTIDYSRNPDDPTDHGTTPPDEVVVYIGTEITINKVDADDNRVVLEGVDFVVTRTAASGGGKEYLNYDASTELITWGAESSKTTFSTDAAGKIVLPPLVDGTYQIEEIATLAGYKLLSAPLEVVITSTIDTTTNPPTRTALVVSIDGTDVTSDADEGTAEVTIENSTGTELPSTGGMGTTILYVVGGILVLGAFVLLITRRKVKAQ